MKKRVQPCNSVAAHIHILHSLSRAHSLLKEEKSITDADADARESSIKPMAMGPIITRRRCGSVLRRQVRLDCQSNEELDGRRPT